MTEDRDKWRKYVHGVAKPRIYRTAKEQNRTVIIISLPFMQCLQFRPTKCFLCIFVKCQQLITLTYIQLYCSLIILERLNSSNDHVTSVDRYIEVSYSCHVNESSWCIHTCLLTTSPSVWLLSGGGANVIPSNCALRHGGDSCGHRLSGILRAGLFSTICPGNTRTGWSVPALADPRGAGRWHAPLAAWASIQNALKVAIFRLKIENIFWGGDNAPSPDPS